MYAASRDPYCYPGTTVLINRLGLRNQSKLDAFEAEVSAERAAQPLKPAAALEAFVASFKGNEHPLRDLIAQAISPS